MIAVVGFGVVGQGIHAYCNRAGIEHYVVARGSILDRTGERIHFLRCDVERRPERIAGFDRVIWASCANPQRFLRLFTGDLDYISSKASGDGTAYGNRLAARERMCLAAPLRSLHIWRVGYAFGDGERPGRLVERIVNGSADGGTVEPLPSEHIGEVVVRNLAGPTMTRDDIEAAIARHAKSYDQPR